MAYKHVKLHGQNLTARSRRAPVYSQIRKIVESGSALRNIADGIGSILDPQGEVLDKRPGCTSSRAAQIMALKTLREFRKRQYSDAATIATDWEQTGADLRKAIVTYKATQPSAKSSQ